MRQVHVTVRFLGLAREWAACSQKGLSVVANPEEVAGWVQEMLNKRGEFSSSPVGIVINGRHINYFTENSILLKDGDIITVIPTISGG